MLARLGASTLEALEAEADRIADEIIASPPDSSPAPADPIAAAPELPGAGSPIPPEVRAFFEPRLGLSLEGMRVHSGLELLKERGAAALASGSHIAFAPGRFRPGTTPGRRLIAHELAHVLQSISAQQRGVSLPRVMMNPDKIVLVQINTTSRAIIFRIDDGTKIVGVLAEDAELPPGRYALNWVQAKGMPTADGIPNFTGFTIEDADQHERYEKLKSSLSNTPLNVIAPKITGDAEGTGTGKKGTGVAGGEKQSEAGGGEKKKGDGGGGGGITDELRKARELLAKVGGQTVPGVEVDEQELAKQVGQMKPEELAELAKFIKETSAAEGLDVNSAAELFAKLTPEQREIIRANVALKAEGTQITSPEQVTVAIKKDAEQTQNVQKAASQLNDSLAKIHDKVTDPTKKKDFEPIDLSKLNFFKEMMLLEGLLAGAASRSPEIGEIAKRLTTAIGEIRGWILEEIMWLAAEIAAGAIFSFLTSGVTLGLSAAVTAGRIALLIRRLNKLRQLIQKVEGAYNIYQKITATFAKLKRASQAFKDFQKKYDAIKETIDKLQSQINLDELAEELPDDLEEAEDKLAEVLGEAIENDEVFGDILENFYLPEDLSEDDLVQVLMDIPKGVEAFKEIIDFYPKVKSSDVEMVTVLSLKGVRAGSYLYPFVGYLADIVEGKLSSLVQGQDFGDRLLGILAKGGKAKGRGKKKNQETIKAAQKAKKERRSKERAKRKKERAELKKKKKEEATKKKNKEKQADSEWAQLKAEVQALEAKYKPNGTTEAELKKELARIRGRYPKVPVKSTVRETRNQGRWTVLVDRKKSRNKVEVKVLMTVALRLRAVQSKLRRKLDDLESDDRTKKKILSTAETFKKGYDIDTIEVKEPKKDSGDPFVVFGTIAGKKMEIGRVDVIVDHHTGSKHDPIPISWYKLEDDHPKSIELKIEGKTKKVKMTDTSTKIEHNGNKVQVGVSANYMVTKYKDLTRRAGSERGKEGQYESALKAHGYDLSKTNESPDHVTDLGMGGDDAFANLWPLDYTKNLRGFGWARDYGIDYLDGGQIKSSNILSLIGKTFRVTSFDTSPKPPRGKGSNRAPGGAKKRKKKS